MDINPIKASQKKLTGIDYFLFWSGVAISLAEIWAGGFLVSLGLWLAILAIILGHVIGNTILGLGGVIGSKHGITSMVSIRPSFGIKGSNIASVFNIIQLIGWASILLIIAGQAGSIIGKNIGGIFALKNFWITAIGLLTLFWAFITGKTIWKILQLIAFVCLFLVIVFITIVSISEFKTTSSIALFFSNKMHFMTALDLVIAMPISFLPIISDYSRFSKNTLSCFLSSWWGFFIASTWMFFLGLIITLSTGVINPSNQILVIFNKFGFAIFALILVVFSTITSNFPDVYSSTCSIMNINKKANAKFWMWIIGILSIIIAIIFPMDQYANYLLFIGAMFIPLFGIVICDYFLINKKKLDIDELYKTNGKYWYYKGYNLKAIFAWLMGFLAYELITITKFFVGGSIPAIIVSAFIYYLLMKKK